MAIIAGLPRFIGYVLDLISCLDIATYPLHLPLAHIMGIYDMRMPRIQPTVSRLHAEEHVLFGDETT